MATKIIENGKGKEIFESRADFWNTKRNETKKCLDAAVEKFPLLILTYPIVIPTKTILDIIVYPFAINMVKYSQKYRGYVLKEKWQ